MNKRNLYDTATDMEEEITKTKAIAELMRMCYTTACGNNCGHNATGTSIYDLEHAFWLIWNMLNEHVNKLDELKDETYEICRKYSSVAGTAV